MISILTVVSGSTQLLRPDIVLGFVGGDTTSAALHFFRIVGMFMVLFGAMLLHALLTSGDNGVAVFWAGMQKLGACAAVAFGVLNGVFSAIALGIAAFDLLSGILIFVYLGRTGSVARRAPPRVVEMDRTALEPR